MFYFSQATTSKPNRFTHEDLQSEAYHLQYGKFCIHDSSNGLHQDFLSKTILNKRFYKGDQWFFDEDIEAFLKDDTGQDRNRIKVAHNLIRPLIEQFRGNAVRLTINASAKSLSKKATNRREKSLSKKILKTQIANEFPALGRLIKASDNAVGDTEAETEEIHENLWIDSYPEIINRLIRYVDKLNELEQMQIMISQNLGLSGLAVIEGFEHGGHQRYDVVPSEEFFFDRSAKKYDLTDSDYMGKCVGMLPTDIYESYEISKDKREAIESFVSDKQNNMGNSIGGTSTGDTNIGSTKIPVCHSYWRDTQKRTAGYVFDEFGYEHLIYLDESINPLTKEVYTEDDLIDPPDTPKNRSIFKGKKKRNSYLDVLRYCIFIPQGAIGNPDGKKEGVQDIVLEFGLAPHQETEWNDISNVKFPFKCFTWGYVDGEIMSPVDDAINPQRLINRILSAAESQINNAGGTNIVVDKSAVDADGGEEKLYADVAQGKPITINTKGRGVPNSLGVYDATPKQGTYNLFNIIPIMEGIIQKDTGVNEGLKGESTGSDQLVGVTQLLIQRGSLMQEPFYNAMAQVFLQVHQHTATIGKRIYLDNQMELAIAVGDDGVEILQLAEDMRNEDFRVFITRENADEILFESGNKMLDVFLGSGLIDEKAYAYAYGRTTPTGVATVLREQSGKREELKRRQEKQAIEEQRTIINEAQEQDKRNSEAIDKEKRDRSIDKLSDQEHDLNKIIVKGEIDANSKIN